MAIKQSFSWWCFAGREATDDAILAHAKEIGYSAVELLPDDKLELAERHGLVIASHQGHRLEIQGLNNPECHRGIEAEILRKIQLAKQFGIENLIVFSGERLDGLSEEEGIENCALGLRRVTAAAEDAGVNLIMELLNSKVDHARYQCDSTSWGVAVCERVGSPRVGLLYDIYHMQIMEGDVIRTIQSQHRHFFHFHTAGNPGRRDMDESQELFYPAIVRAINGTGYSGYLGHEFIPKGDVLSALETAFDLCDL
jgi:hydroxypyruvate isomerase